MNILITGIHGFVGSNLVDVLEREHILYGLDIVSPAKEGVVITFSWQDLEPTFFSFSNSSPIRCHYSSCRKGP